MEIRKKLLVKKEIFDNFEKLFTVYGVDTIPMGDLEDKPLLIPRRWFGGSGNISIPMKIKFDADFKCQCIMVKKSDYDEMLSYFRVYEGEFDVPMLRKVFEFPSEHLPNDNQGSFRLVCHINGDDTVNEPKIKQGGKDGYTIDL